MSEASSPPPGEPAVLAVAQDPPGRRPSHRIVGRALVVAAACWPLVGAACTAFMFAGHRGGFTGLPDFLAPSASELVESGAAIGLGAAIAGALVSVATELALGVRRVALRLPILFAGGLAGAVGACWLVAWIYLVVTVGPGAAPGVFIHGVVGWWLRHPMDSLAILAFSSALSTGFCAPRALPWPGRAHGWPRLHRLGLSCAMGFIAGLVAKAVDADRYLIPDPYWQVPGAFLFGSMVTGLALDLGELLDDALVIRWRRRREALGRT